MGEVKHPIVRDHAPHMCFDLPFLRSQRRQDGLTELFTAPYLTETCTRELNRGHRFNRPLCLLLLDIDGLGALNAAHGPQAGDAVLRGTAGTIKRATREYDLPARLVGGLFAVLLPETDLARAQAVAERIRRTTAERRHDIRNSFEQARITVSIGAAVYSSGQVTVAELFEVAQNALKRAKSDGGNRVEFAAIQGTPLPAQTPRLAVDRHSVSAGEIPLVNVVRSETVRRWTARYWGQAPELVALCGAALLVAYAYYRFGLGAATLVAAAALLLRHLAIQYVERTLESVRELRSANEQLEHRAFHDPLTSLANRALFAERLEHAIVRAGQGSVAVLFLDLDNFKTINDTLGHAAGDAVLVATTERLLQCVRREDTIARLGGDEFTVLLEDMQDPSDAARMAERIGEALREPFEVAGKSVTISSSIGIALDTDRSHAPNDLLREADLAMYRAKAGGKARYEIFDTGLGSRAVERLEMETELRRAIERRELLLHYQPVVSLASGQVDAVEALLRWQHPRRGLLVASEFLPIAEQTGTMAELGNWALVQACSDAAQWQRLRPGIVVQANLSRAELAHPTLAAYVAETLNATDLSPACLRLEVPESAFAQDGETTAAVMNDLRALGVRLALDDVGGGLSSLTWLSRLQVDVLKISASAVDSAAMVRASVALGVALGMTVTAQAVARLDQSVRLAALGCQHAQGPLYGKPMTADDVADLLASSSDRTELVA